MKSNLRMVWDEYKAIFISMAICYFVIVPMGICTILNISFGAALKGMFKLLFWLASIVVAIIVAIYVKGNVDTYEGRGKSLVMLQIGSVVGLCLAFLCIISDMNCFLPSVIALAFYIASNRIKKRMKTDERVNSK